MQRHSSNDTFELILAHFCEAETKKNIHVS